LGPFQAWRMSPTIGREETHNKRKLVIWRIWKLIHDLRFPFYFIQGPGFRVFHCGYVYYTMSSLPQRGKVFKRKSKWELSLIKWSLLETFTQLWNPNNWDSLNFENHLSTRVSIYPTLTAQLGKERITQHKIISFWVLLLALYFH
jgi:hypothetical protein